MWKHSGSKLLEDASLRLSNVKIYYLYIIEIFHGILINISLSNRKVCSFWYYLIKNSFMNMLTSKNNIELPIPFHTIYKNVGAFSSSALPRCFLSYLQH
jgi:hypothetical protein